MPVEPPKVALAEPEPDAAGARVREFEAVEVGTLLRLLARQARVNLVLSDQVLQTASPVSFRLEDATALEAIQIVCRLKNFLLIQDGNIYYVKHPRERLEAMRFVSSPELAKALAGFRARQRKELLAGGFSKEEAAELLRLDQVLPENLLLRGGPSVRSNQPAPVKDGEGTDEDGAEEATEPSPTPRVPTRDLSEAKSREFLGVETVKVVRQLAKEAHVNLVVSDRVRADGGTVTIRLEGVNALDAIKIICQAKGYVLLDEGLALYVRHQDEKFRDWHYLDDADLAVSLAAFRVGQMRELLGAGFTRVEAMEVLKVDRLQVEKMLSRVPAAAGASSVGDPGGAHSGWAPWLIGAALLHALLVVLGIIRWGEREAAGFEASRAWLAAILLLPAGGLIYLFLGVSRPPRIPVPSGPPRLQ